ncbi:hypothetical protein CHELA1G11_13667 [Hyphomicrobiales bacterium]|nr:hypothetical protein CHELA1G2_10648 [Hyphomicrobiales bacterium]CAH1673198.1 hypothetical protein CHELA1G11_13667 [Hyphomicrobiales bacterium]
MTVRRGVSYIRPISGGADGNEGAGGEVFSERQDWLPDTRVSGGLRIVFIGVHFCLRVRVSGF